MREIKFKFWSEYNKRFYTDLVIEGNGDLYDKDDLGNSEIDYSEAKLSKNKFKICQYTGLKDKNSKEIYEGDILKTEKDRYTVKWDIKYLTFSLISINNIDTEMILYSSNADKFKVIGNVYENPELLEQ